MYLRKLYHHNKALFVLVFIFALVQLVNNIRRDAAISPVYAYGMYSEVMTPQREYLIPRVTVNGKPLYVGDFSPQEWDKIYLPLILFRRQEQHNKAVYTNNILPLFHFGDAAVYTNQMSTATFDNWYRQYLQTITGVPNGTVDISWQQYFFNGFTFQPVKP